MSEPAPAVIVLVGDFTLFAMITNEPRSDSSFAFEQVVQTSESPIENDSNGSDGMHQRPRQSRRLTQGCSGPHLPMVFVIPIIGPHDSCALDASYFATNWRTLLATIAMKKTDGSDVSIDYRRSRLCLPPWVGAS
jgi:hypothetical protein